MRILDKHYINGKFVESKGNDILDLVNPSNKKVIGQLVLGSEEDARDAIKAAKEAFKTWSKTTIDERKNYLQKLSDAVLARMDDHLEVMMEEYGGRPISVAKFSVQGAANAYLAAKTLLQEIEFFKDFDGATVKQKPLGVAALITPWNQDIFGMSIKIAPAIAAGCTVVVKPSELSGLQTQVFMECIAAAGLPAGVINIVNGLGNVIGNELTTHPDVSKVSFTGSTAVGKLIMKNGADTMKRVTLELGGKSAHIFLDDVDLKKAIPFALRAAFQNSGQACIAGTRLLIPESRVEEIYAALKAGVEQIKVGLAKDPDTFVAAVVTEKQYNRVQDYIQKGLDEGAKLLIGGIGEPEGLESGYFVKPTVFVNVKNSMTIAQEEIFGPVLSVITYKTEEEAVSIANDSAYGLFGWISSADLNRAKAIGEQLETGGIMINEFANVFDYPGVPAGGFKQSGIGREFGRYGFEEYLQTQSVYGK